MRKAILGAAVLAIAVPVFAATGGGQGGVDKQSFAWTTEPAKTSSIGWTNIPGLQVDIGCFQQTEPATATLSLELEGLTPVQIRVAMRGVTDLGEPGVAMRPGAVTYTPGVGSPAARDVASFTFVHRDPPENHGTTFMAQWRSPTGGEATVRKGTLNVLWDDVERDRICL